jgi:hypothetical protein
MSNRAEDEDEEPHTQVAILLAEDGVGIAGGGDGLVGFFASIASQASATAMYVASRDSLSLAVVK